MKKLLITTIAFVVFIFGTGSANAATISELQAQIQSLLLQITTLKTQMSQGDAMTPNVASSCPNLARNLFRGSRGTDVIQLQQFLISQNLLASDSATGFFGAMTESAVKQFQCSKMSICSGSPSSNGYGAVGPRTRDAVAAACTITIPTPVIPPIAPTVPITSTVTPTYSWQTGGWSTCTNSVQSRSVSCVSSINATASDTFCTSTRPAVSQSCTITTIPQNQSCTFNNQTIAHGASASAYQTASVAYGQTCAQQTRTCTNGTFSGSYTYASCTPASPTCTPLVAQTQTLSCPTGQTGSITQTRTSSCPGPTWGSWATVTNTCTTPTQPPPVTSSVQPASVPTKVLSAVGGNGVLIDFLIQDVCVDSNNRPIKGDPATCSNHRDLKFGEFVPYMRNDASLSSAARATINYPTQAPDGSLRTMYTFDFGNTASSAFRDYDGDGVNSFNDGFSLGEGNGQYASLIVTQDAGGFQPFWNPSCGHEDTWMLFPLAATKSTSGIIPAKLAIAPTCPTGFTNGADHWKYLAQPFTYTSGKMLDTIYQESVTLDANGNTTGDHIEITYFTKEYGNTRWESWYFGSGPTQAGCNGADHADFGYGPMYRYYCTDWSFLTDQDVASNPLTNPYGRDFVLSKNLLSSGDFAGQGIGVWKQWTSPMTDWELGKDSKGNSFLNFACWSGCSSNALGSVYQDVDVSNLHVNLTLRFGALLKAAQAAHASIALHFYDASGAYIFQTTLPLATLDASWQHVDGTATWDFNSKPLSKIRFQIYIPDSGILYMLDEAYLTPSI